MGETPFPVIRLKGTARDRGRQYGEACRSLIAATVVFYRRVFEHESRLNWTASLDKAAEFIAPIRDYDPDMIEEIEGIAAGSGFRLEEIVAINARTELLFLLAARGEATPQVCCTAVGAAPDATAGGQTLLAQNWDWYAATQAQCVVLHIQQAPRPDILQVVEAGLIAKTGMNSAGIGMCTNALVCTGWRVGVPYHAILRGILNAGSLGQAVGAVTTPRRASAGNYLIGHAHGEIIDIEAGPRDINVIFPETGIISHANHFHVPNPAIRDRIPGIWPDSLVRGLRAARLMSAARGGIDAAGLQSLLRDHFDHPASICSHGDPGQPLQDAHQTNVSLVMDLGAGKMDVAKGPPCEHPFVPITVPF